MSITTNSRLTLTIGGAVGLIILLVGTTWRAADAFNALRKEMSDMRRDITAVSAERWSTTDMERWAYRLERSNREKALVVPDVRGVRDERSIP